MESGIGILLESYWDPIGVCFLGHVLYCLVQDIERSSAAASVDPIFPMLGGDDFADRHSSAASSVGRRRPAAHFGEKSGRPAGGYQASGRLRNGDG